MTRVTAEPTARFSPFGGKVEVFLFGPPFNWSLNAGSGNLSVLANTLTDLRRKIRIDSIFAPDPSQFNAQICIPETFFEDDYTHRHINLRAFEGSYDGPRIMCGPFADGVRLRCPVHEAVWISSADCPTLILMDELGDVVVAHAGRDCLFDQSRVLGNGPSREHESVVEAACDALSGNHVRAFITCGIGPRRFDHPMDFGEHQFANVKIVTNILHKYGPHCVYGDTLHGRLVLSEIIRAQLIEAGVREFDIGFDGIDTYTDMPYVKRDGGPDRRSPCFWSHRRGDRERNGVLVVMK